MAGPSAQDFAYHGELAGSFDEDSGMVAGIANRLGIARAESMDLSNDPRFFSANVIDKRLKAFGSLSIVSGLMLGTSMGQCFELPKDWDLTPEAPFIGYFQLVGFVLQMTVTFLCLISLYVIAHQLFYTYRLMTSGPTGFECACVFYLSKYMVMWRHFAIKCLLNGLWLFMLSSGFQLFGKFYKDAEETWDPPKEKLDMKVHSIIALSVFMCFAALACLLCLIRAHHVAAFREEYANIKNLTRPIQNTMVAMSKRSGLFLDT